MSFYIDDKPVDDQAVRNGTLEEAVRHVQGEFCGPDRMVVALRCDGRDVPADQMAEALERPAVEFDRVEIITGTRGELVADAMAQASACLSETETACEDIARLLTEGQSQEGIQTLGECLGIWQRVHDAVGKSIDMLEIDPDAVLVADTPLSELVSRPRQILMQMRDALKNRDHVLLADVLQYEFAEVTNDWHRVITRLRREAEERKPQTGDTT